jgi:hypothetical protein
MARHITDRKFPEMIFFTCSYIHYKTPVQSDPGTHPASYTKDKESFPRVTRSGHGVNHPVSSTGVKEKVELYLYSPTGPLWPVLR